MDNTKNYLAYAENDYKALKQLQKTGQQYDIIGLLSEQVVEKTLKHLICLQEEIGEKEHFIIPHMLYNSQHNLSYLCSRAVQDGMITCSNKFKKSLNILTNAYTQTRYPNSDFSYHIKPQDIALMIGTVEMVRLMAAESIKNWEAKKEILTETDKIISSHLNTLEYEYNER